jgi:hypothetical protein
VTKIVSTYVYTDEAGEPLFEAVRLEPKQFMQRLPGASTYGIGETRRVLYHLPQLLAADPNEWVLLVEGEKDVHTAESLGFVATCNPMGAVPKGEGPCGKWPLELGEPLRGRKVVLIPDDDPVDEKLKYSPGLEHVKRVGRLLKPILAGQKYLRLTQGSAKEDLTDWVNGGGTREELLRLIAEARDVIAQPAAALVAAAEPAVVEEAAQQISEKLSAKLTATPKPPVFGGGLPDNYDPVAHLRRVGRELGLLAFSDLSVSDWCQFAQQQLDGLVRCNQHYVERQAYALLETIEQKRAKA